MLIVSMLEDGKLVFVREKKMLHSIKTSAYEALPTGIYRVVFNGMKSIESKNGPVYRWEFKTDDGKSISGLSGEPGKTATLKNKFGRWLCAIAGRPLTEGEVDPDQFVGKKYQSVVGAEGNLEMFTPSA